MFRVGNWDIGYLTQRMVINRAEGCSYVQVKNKRIHYSRLLRVLAKIAPCFVPPNTLGDATNFTVSVPKNTPIDIMHTYNRVCMDNVHNWVATVEGVLPGYFRKPSSRYIRSRLKYILSEKCKALMPMSKWAWNNEINIFTKFASADEARLLQSKMKLLYPPQECLVNHEGIDTKFGVVGGGATEWQDTFSVCGQRFSAQRRCNITPCIR